VPEIAQAVWPLEKLLEIAYRSRPDIKVAIEQLETNRRGLTYARAQQVPDPMFGGGYVFSTYLKDQNVPVQRGIYLNVNMDMPVIYHHQGEVELAKANYRQSQKQLDATRAQVETDVHTAYQAFVAARENIVKYQSEILPKASEVVRLARRSYETGFQPISAVIVAQQQYQQTRSSYFDTVVAYQNAWADLERATGQPLALP
jgi:cobalt-zinc-cadmium efflux system outer membrane protein